MPLLFLRHQTLSLFVRPICCQWQGKIAPSMRKRWLATRLVLVSVIFWRNVPFSHSCISVKLAVILTLSNGSVRYYIMLRAMYSIRSMCHVVAHFIILCRGEFRLYKHEFLSWYGSVQSNSIWKVGFGSSRHSVQAKGGHCRQCQATRTRPRRLVQGQSVLARCELLMIHVCRS